MYYVLYEKQSTEASTVSSAVKFCLGYYFGFFESSDQRYVERDVKHISECSGMCVLNYALTFCMA